MRVHPSAQVPASTEIFRADAFRSSQMLVMVTIAMLVIDND